MIPVQSTRGENMPLRRNIWNFRCIWWWFDGVRLCCNEGNKDLLLHRVPGNSVEPQCPRWASLPLWNKADPGNVILLIAWQKTPLSSLRPCSFHYSKPSIFGCEVTKIGVMTQNLGASPQRTWHSLLKRGADLSLSLIYYADNVVIILSFFLSV